jgi:hypothetical protein
LKLSDFDRGLMLLGELFSAATCLDSSQPRHAKRLRPDELVLAVVIGWGSAIACLRERI